MDILKSLPRVLALVGTLSAPITFAAQPLQISAMDTTVHLSSGHSYVLPDSETIVAMRRTHAVVRLSSGVEAPALPYVKVDGAWLEIVNEAVVAVDRLRFTLDRERCYNVRRYGDDFTFSELDACDIRIRTDTCRASAPETSTFETTFRFDTRHEALSVHSMGGSFIAVRLLGFDIGNIDETKTPWLPMSINAGVDIVLPTGVANIDFVDADQPVIGLKRATTIGGCDLEYWINDVGNVNTHCHTGKCINVFDLTIVGSVNGTVSGPARIISYR